MPRRRDEDGEFHELFEMLKVAPIWLGPIVAVVFFVLLRYVMPLFIPRPQAGIDGGVIFRPMLSALAWVFAGLTLLAWIAAEMWKLFNRFLLDKHSGLSSFDDITWQEFERLVSEAYRRKGYIAEVVGSASGDGGVDIRLRGNGETVLVQCKQWKVYSVGVSVVREMLGVVVSERARRGIVVTSGRFTREAELFAQKNPQIELLDGPRLDELIRGVQTNPSHVPPSPPPLAPDATANVPRCPTCGNQMILRKARSGTRPGSQFWGCRGYPTCRGTRPI